MESANSNYQITWEVEYSETSGVNWSNGRKNSPTDQNLQREEPKGIPSGLFRGRQVSAPPSARSGHTAIYIPLLDSVFLYGGAADVLFNDMYEYHVPNQQWYLLQCIGTPPVPTFGHTAALLEDGFTMVVYGGQCDVLSIAITTTDQWIHFNCVTCEWQQHQLKCPSMTRGDLSLWGHSMIKLSPKYDSRLLVFGGSTNLDGAKNDVLLVDPKSFGVLKVASRSSSSSSFSFLALQWRQPLARRCHTVELYREDYMFMFGGRNSSSPPQFFNDLWIYHIGANIWVRIDNDVPSAFTRRFLSNPICLDEVTQAAGEIFVVQEETLSLLGPSIYEKPTPRTGHISFLLDDVFYVCTGYLFRHAQRTAHVFDDVFAYDIARNQWSRLPFVAASDVRPTARSMAAAVLIPSSQQRGSRCTTRPFLFFHGGRAGDAIADCFFCSVGRPAPTLFQCCAQWLIDVKARNLVDGSTGPLVQHEMEVAGGAVLPSRKETSFCG